VPDLHLGVDLQIRQPSQMPGPSAQLQILQVVVQLIARGEQVREQLAAAGHEAAVVDGRVLALERVAARHRPGLDALAHPGLLHGVLDVQVQEERVQAHLVILDGILVAEVELRVRWRPMAPPARQRPVLLRRVVAPWRRRQGRARWRPRDEHALLVAPLLGPYPEWGVRRRVDQALEGAPVEDVVDVKLRRGDRAHVREGRDGGDVGSEVADRHGERAAAVLPNRVVFLLLLRPPHGLGQG
jgi:hypothetical protein